MEKMVIFGLVLVATFLGSIGAIFLKKGSNTLSRKTLFTNYNLFIGFGFYFLSIVVFVLALRKGELSFVYPIVATSYIWASLLSVKYLGEKLNMYKMLGIGIIIIGVTFIGVGA